MLPMRFISTNVGFVVLSVREQRVGSLRETFCN